MTVQMPRNLDGVSSLRVFMYHSVGERKPDDKYGLTVSKELFEAQIDHLLESGSPFVKVDHNIKDFSGIQPGAVGVTFDDGYRDNLIAAEVLIEKSVPFTIYCIAEMIGHQDFLSMQHLRELSATGLCTIGAHGLTHRRLGDLSEDDQKNELFRSRDLLEQGLGQKVTTMSLPHGSLNSKTLPLAKEFGYEVVCSSRPGINFSQNFRPYHVRRTEIRSADSLESFIEKSQGSDDWRRFVYLGRSILSWAIDAQWVRFR